MSNFTNIWYWKVVFWFIIVIFMYIVNMYICLKCWKIQLNISKHLHFIHIFIVLLFTRIFVGKVYNATTNPWTTHNSCFFLVYNATKYGTKIMLKSWMLHVKVPKFKMAGKMAAIALFPMNIIFTIYSYYMYLKRVCVHLQGT